MKPRIVTLRDLEEKGQSEFRHRTKDSSASISLGQPQLSLGEIALRSFYLVTLIPFHIMRITTSSLLLQLSRLKDSVAPASKPTGLSTTATLMRQTEMSEEEYQRISTSSRMCPPRERTADPAIRGRLRWLESRALPKASDTHQNTLSSPALTRKR